MRVAVIGGGPAGMMAAIAATCNGHDVTLLEKNNKLGKKLFITGKGRCNICSNCDAETVIKNTVSNAKFLYAALAQMSPSDLQDFFINNGLSIKTERGNRVFPTSDKSSDVIATLANCLKNYGVAVKLSTEVRHIIVKKEGFSLDCRSYSTNFDAVIIATGGYSYRATGSTGDGYKFAHDLGHSIVDVRGALIPLKPESVQDRAFLSLPSLEGLSLKNVTLTAQIHGKVVYKELGEMLFTSDGMSGPLVLTASSLVNRAKKEDITLVLDLKPALSLEELDARVLRDFDKIKNKQFKNALDALLPQKLIPFIVDLCGISPTKEVNAITKQERLELVKLLKNLTFKNIVADDIDYGIITAGGVNVKEVNPKTMESKIVKHLYFAGEVLDVDAFTGGYNLQIAFSTGYTAGISVMED